TDSKALTVSDRIINGKEFAKIGDDRRKDLLLVSGKALYNIGKLKESRERFETALKLRPKDVEVKRGLVAAIQAQAYNAFNKKDYKSASNYLDQASAVDATVPGIALDRAVMSIDAGDCDGAQKYLAKLQGVQGYTLVYERLIARTYLCGKKPDPKKAAEHY